MEMPSPAHERAEAQVSGYSETTSRRFATRRRWELVGHEDRKCTRGDASIVL